MRGTTDADFVLPFQRGVRYPLSRLDAYITSFERARSANKTYSNAIGLSSNREVRALHDELYPLRIFARHACMIEEGQFEWRSGGETEDGVDFVVSVGSCDRSLQITTTGPIWPDASHPYDNPGYQHRLLRELLSNREIVAGRGPWERRDGEVVGGCSDFTSADRDLAFRKGILAAYTRKCRHRGAASELVIRINEAPDFMNVGEFRRIAEGTRAVAPLDAFEKVHLVDYPDGFAVSLE